MILDHAKELAAAAIKAIGPYCLRAEVTGITRREWFVDIKRVGIIAIPDTRDMEKLRALRDVVNTRWSPPVKGEFPSKHTTINGLMGLDFFWVSAPTWGYNQFFRTGGDWFVQNALIYWKKKFKGDIGNGHLYGPDGEIVPTPEEEDVFKALQCDFVPPNKRLNES